MKPYCFWAVFLVCAGVQVKLLEACPYSNGNSNVAAPEDGIHGRRLQAKSKPPSIVPSISPTQIPTTSSPTAGVTTPTASPTTYPDNVLGACKKSILASTSANVCSAYKSIKTSFDSATSTKGTLSSIYGAAVRLAFHDAGEVDIRTTDLNGPDGCLAQVGDSAGLIESDSLVTTLIEPMWQEYCDKITRADFWVLFAKLSIEKSSGYNMSIPFHFGRKDRLVCNDGDHRLPAAGLGQAELSRVFVDQMGLTIPDAATLLGAHTVGHTHIIHSGFGKADSAYPNVAADFINSWDNTPSVFDNNYYFSLANRQWKSIQAPNTTKVQNEWHFDKFSNIMLNADMSIGFDLDTTDGVGVVGQVCGPSVVANNKAGCVNPRGANYVSTSAQVRQYMLNNTMFQNDFVASFVKMVNVGYGYEGSVGKLGSLTSINFTTCDQTSRPSAVPSLAPTPLPTKKPTAVVSSAARYQFGVKQELQGVSSTDYSTNLASNNGAFCGVITSALSESADCVVNSVTQSTTTTTSLRTLSTVKTVLIAYTLSYDIVSLGFANQPATAFATLKTRLANAVENGYFTTFLQARAALNGNTDLSSVTSSSVVADNTYTEVNTGSTTSDSSDSSSNNDLIIGVVVGVGGSLLLMCFAFFWFYMRSASGATQKTVDGVKKEEKDDVVLIGNGL